MLLALIASFSLFAAEPAASDAVIARVEGFEIYASEFAAAAKGVRPADGKALSEAERQAVLDRLVGDRLLLAEAKKNNDVYDDPGVRAALVKAVLKADVEGIKEPTEAELSAYYEANKQKFKTPDQARVSRILVRVTPKKNAAAAEAEAKKLLAAVAKDPKSTFAATAKASSQDPNKAEGGDMGLVNRLDKKLDPAAKKAIFAAKAGTVTRVVVTKEGANIYYVVSRKAPVQKTLDEARVDVERQWRADQLAKAKEAHVERLKKTGRVSVDKAALAAVSLPAAPVAKGWVKGGKAGAAPAEPDAGDEDDSGDDE